RLAALVFATVAMLAVPFASNAQTLYGSLTGNVTDASGAGVPGAKVAVVGVDTGIGKQGAADDRGTFVIPDLQAGLYKVTITAPSFATVVEPSVEVDANTVRRLDVQL